MKKNTKYLIFQSLAILFISVVATISPVLSQSIHYPNQQKEVYFTTPIAYVQDSHYIIPETVFILHNQYQVSWKTIGKRIELHSDIIGISIEIKYRVFPVSLDFKNQDADDSKIETYRTIKSIDYKDKSNDLFSETNVEYAGALGRGISFGTNQNLVLNSTLNMQISGKIGDEIEINAAISDESIPIQTDGNTSQLNELDNVFIELKKKNQRLIAGDMQIKPDDSYFLRYNKKYKGLQYIHTQDFKKGHLQTKLQGAIARGNFKRQQLIVSEGNQGPYRLTGQNNELFIVILSGSEKIYIDGQLQIRGLENDYVIDYNRSEVSFTAKRIINQNSRVVVEFEYSNQSYLKSALAFESKYMSKNWTAQWNSYQETDTKNSNNTIDLTQEDKRILQEAGDHTNNLLRSTIRESNFETDLILYEKTDTTVNGVLYSDVLVLKQSKDSKSVTAQFTYVGTGHGNYVIEKALFTNGRAYRWIAPDANGTKQGEYEPVVYLSTPKKQALHTIKLEYHPEKNIYLRTDIGISKLDENLFSNKDKSNDVGIAWKQIIRTNSQIRNILWQNEFSLEKQAKQFSIFEPFRNPEFNRDWSLQNTLKNGDDLLMQLKTGFENGPLKVHYGIQRYEKNIIYQGINQVWNTEYKSKNTTFLYSGSSLSNENQSIHGKFTRPRLMIDQTIPGLLLSVGASYEKEKNQQVLDDGKRLQPMSFSFYILKSYIKGKIKNEAWNYKIDYSKRTDEKTEGISFVKDYVSEEFSFSNQLKFNKRTSWNIRLTDRVLTYNSPINKNEKNAHTLIWRHSIDTRSKSEKIRLHQTLEGGTGQEPSIEYTYVKVNKGTGYYTWIDINHDSIVQVSEFTIANFADQGEYLRYAITNNDLTFTKNFQFLQDFEWTGNQNKMTKNWIDYVSFNSNISYQWKTNNEAEFIFPTLVSNPYIISLQGIFRNQIYINKGGKKMEIQIGQSLSNNKWRLSTGSEARSVLEVYIRSRHTLSKLFYIENYLGNQTQQNTAEYFHLKDLKLKSTTLEPSIHFQQKQNMRFSIGYKYRSGTELLQSIKTDMHEIKAETTVQPSNKWSIRNAWAFIQAHADGKINPWNEFNLFQGLRQGNNTVIQLNIERMISENTILRIGYVGRKSEGIKYMQTGNVQVVAGF